VEPFLKQLEPGNDGFPLERQAAELDARLRELSDAIRGGRDRAADVTTDCSIRVSAAHGWSRSKPLRRVKRRSM
jgi:hypothetical protein